MFAAVALVISVIISTSSDPISVQDRYLDCMAGLAASGILKGELLSIYSSDAPKVVKLEAMAATMARQKLLLLRARLSFDPIRRADERLLYDDYMEFMGQFSVPGKEIASFLNHFRQWAIATLAQSTLPYYRELSFFLGGTDEAQSPLIEQFYPTLDPDRLSELRKDVSELTSTIYRELFPPSNELPPPLSEIAFEGYYRFYYSLPKRFDETSLEALEERFQRAAEWGERLPLFQEPIEGPVPDRFTTPSQRAHFYAWVYYSSLRIPLKPVDDQLATVLLPLAKLDHAYDQISRSTPILNLLPSESDFDLDVEIAILEIARGQSPDRYRALSASEATKSHRATVLYYLGRPLDTALFQQDLPRQIKTGTDPGRVAYLGLDQADRWISNGWSQLDAESQFTILLALNPDQPVLAIDEFMKRTRTWGENQRKITLGLVNGRSLSEILNAPLLDRAPTEISEPDRSIRLLSGVKIPRAGRGPTGWVTELRYVEDIITRVLLYHQIPVCPQHGPNRDGSRAESATNCLRCMEERRARDLLFEFKKSAFHEHENEASRFGDPGRPGLTALALSVAMPFAEAMSPAADLAEPARNRLKSSFAFGALWGATARWIRPHLFQVLWSADAALYYGTGYEMSVLQLGPATAYFIDDTLSAGSQWLSWSETGESGYLNQAARFSGNLLVELCSISLGQSAVRLTTLNPTRARLERLLYERNVLGAQAINHRQSRLVRLRAERRELTRRLSDPSLRPSERSRLSRRHRAIDAAISRTSGGSVPSYLLPHVLHGPLFRGLYGALASMLNPMGLYSNSPSLFFGKRNYETRRAGIDIEVDGLLARFERSRLRSQLRTLPTEAQKKISGMMAKVDRLKRAAARSGRTLERAMARYPDNPASLEGPLENFRRVQVELFEARSELRHWLPDDGLGRAPRWLELLAQGQDMLLGRRAYSTGLSAELSEIAFKERSLRQELHELARARSRLDDYIRSQRSAWTTGAPPDLSGLNNIRSQYDRSIDMLSDQTMPRVQTLRSRAIELGRALHP